MTTAERRLYRLAKFALGFGAAVLLVSGSLSRVSLALTAVGGALATVLLVLSLPLVSALGPWGRRLPRWALLFWRMVGRVLGLPGSALVAVNNRIALKTKAPPRQVLVMASHCLQHSSCSNPVAADSANCRRCGRCAIGDMVRICRDRGVRFTVEPGGTAARARRKSLAPKLVVAVACERELVEGIADTPVPVVGVAVIPSDKPCTNNRVDLALFKDYLDRIIEEDD